MSNNQSSLGRFDGENVTIKMMPANMKVQSDLPGSEDPVDGNEPGDKKYRLQTFKIKS